MSKPVNRRNFVKKAAFGGVMTCCVPEIVSAAFNEEQWVKKQRISKNDVILFQGDSITDFHRDRGDNKPNSADAMGVGYAAYAATDLVFRYPEKQLLLYNRGVSGNKVYQLAERWENDCLKLKPDVLSILVGVNDFWHTLVRDYDGTVETYKKDYVALLEKTKQKLPDVKLIIGEPYAIPGVKSVDQSWYPSFNKYRQAAREVAEKFDAVFIPYQEIYNKALKHAPGSYWTLDGVHPTMAGAGLMAHAWLKAIKG